MDAAALDRVYAPKVDGAWALHAATLACGEQLSFTAFSSIASSLGAPGQTNYSAAKAGMHGFTKALAQEVARKGVTVNTVSPGYLDTKMVTSMSEEVVKQVTAGIPVGRLGRPEEIAALVAFIASESAGFMTGSNVSMNGGQHMY